MVRIAAESKRTCLLLQATPCMKASDLRAKGRGAEKGGANMEHIQSFFQEEDGVGVVEIILILVVLIGLVLIFKDQLTSLVNSIFSKIVSQSSSV